LARPLALTLAALAPLLGFGVAPAGAGSAWDGIRTEVYGSRPMLDGSAVMRLSAPNRPEDQRRVPVSIDARLGDGHTIKTVTFVVDENPSPIAAVFHLGPGRDRVAIGTRLRVNAQSDVRVVVEADDGTLYMVGQLVKFAGGQAACSAPPSGDPREIAEGMGRMELAETKSVANVTPINRPVHLSLSHPNHTGMVMDQQTLLYTPLLMVDHVAVRQGGDTVVEIDGSITLAQNPEFDFDFKTNGADHLDVSVSDTGGGHWQKSLPLGPSS
jgi:sulfur-oxidizing protein SoxY